MPTAPDVQQSRVLRRNPKIEEAPLQAELMLFDPSTSKFFVLNRTMAFIWRHCDGEQTLGRILDALAAEFSSVEPSAAEADLRKAVDELVSFGLVVD